jgi:hypothetical protein
VYDCTFDMGGEGEPVKGLKTTLTIAIAMAIGLLAGSAVGVAAQDDAGMEPSFFTAQFGDGTGFEDSELVGADPEFSRTLNITGTTVDATDPRASGVMDLAASSRCFGAEGCPDADVRVLSMRLENDDGSWEGTGLGLAPRNNRNIEVWNLSGEDGYEGLSMVMVVGGNKNIAKAALKGKKLKKNAVPTAWGWISPTSDIPAVPDLPVAE